MANAPLRLDDLVSRGKPGSESISFMSVNMPILVLDRIAGLAEKLRTSKTAVIIAILNEGLEKADSELKGWKAPFKPVIPRERRCTAPGCENEKLARDRCMKHYQAHRRAHWGQAQ